MAPAHRFVKSRNSAGAARLAPGGVGSFIPSCRGWLRRACGLALLAPANKSAQSEQRHASRRYFHPRIPLANLYDNVSMTIP